MTSVVIVASFALLLQTVPVLNCIFMPCYLLVVHQLAFYALGLHRQAGAYSLVMSFMSPSVCRPYGFTVMIAVDEVQQSLRYGSRFP